MNQQNERNKLGLSSAALHIMAMLFMLLDHTWATVLAYPWMTCVGRLAFPIFAFLTVEGFFHTRNLKNYMLRMLLFAVISEIPFNLMYGGQLIYPVHQNVLWTFLIALSGIQIMEKSRRKGNPWLSIPVCFGVCLLGVILGYTLFVDYYGCGVLTVFVFYFFYRGKEDNFLARRMQDKDRAKTLWSILCVAGQFICLYYINVEVLGGFYYNVTLFGRHFELMQQGLALLAFVPIWLYRGRQGYHAKWFRLFNYAFYPAHCLTLALMAMWR